jgi:hypothetical protein
LCNFVEGNVELNWSLTGIFWPQGENIPEYRYGRETVICADAGRGNVEVEVEVEVEGMLVPIVIVNQIDARGYRGPGRE